MRRSGCTDLSALPPNRCDTLPEPTGPQRSPSFQLADAEQAHDEIGKTATIRDTALGLLRTHGQH
jgi:hypothetical protein